MSDDIFTFSEHDPGGKVKLALPDYIKTYALYSPCKRYRYELHRWWDDGNPIRSVMFLMMNPSTATEHVDDPTVRKCRKYAEMWGFNHLIVGNIMAYRATSPKDLLTVDDPIGPENAKIIKHLMTRQPPINSISDMLNGPPFLVCAWGKIPKKLKHAEDQALKIIGEFMPHVLRLNKDGMPWHPLYLPDATKPVLWPINIHNGQPHS